MRLIRPGRVRPPWRSSESWSLRVSKVDSVHWRMPPPSNAPERVVATTLLERTLQPGETVICDKGFAGREFEQHIRSLGATILRPDRKDEQPRFGQLERIAGPALARFGY